MSCFYTAVGSPTQPKWNSVTTTAGGDRVDGREWTRQALTGIRTYIQSTPLKDYERLVKQEYKDTKHSLTGLRRYRARPLPPPLYFQILALTC